jgi:hypothetical protein
MNTNLKKAILIFGGGLFLFWAFKKIKPIDVKTTTKSDKDTSVSASGEPTEEQKANIPLVMKAYLEAKKAGESKQFLAEMNREFIKEYGLKVMSDKGSGKLFVADSNGSKVS